MHENNDIRADQIAQTDKLPAGKRRGVISVAEHRNDAGEVVETRISFHSNVDAQIQTSADHSTQSFEGSSLEQRDNGLFMEGSAIYGAGRGGWDGVVIHGPVEKATFTHPGGKPLNLYVNGKHQQQGKTVTYSSGGGGLLGGLDGKTMLAGVALLGAVAYGGDML